MDEKIVEECVAAAWDAREATFEPRLRRKMDQMDDATGAADSLRLITHAIIPIIARRCAEIAREYPDKNDSPEGRIWADCIAAAIETGLGATAASAVQPAADATQDPASGRAGTAPTSASPQLRG